MKNSFKYLMIFIVVLLAIKIIYTIFAHFQPSPSIISKINNNSTHLNTDFHQIDDNYWELHKNKLIFNNKSIDKQMVTLFTDQLPSEHKRDGFITSKVTVSTNFDNIDKNCIYGFQIGEVDTSEDAHIIMGINGLGKIVVLNGDMENLSEEEVVYGNDIQYSNTEDVILSLHYFGNPYGWIIFFDILDTGNEEYLSQTYINFIPPVKLDSNEKELSLVAFNPSQVGEIYFTNWQIQNDWTPND